MSAELPVNTQASANTPASANTQASAPERPARKKPGIVGKLAAFLAGSTVLALIAILVLWFVARPKGELRLAVDAGQSESEAKEIRNLFNHARQKVREVVNLHNHLGLGQRRIEGDPVPAGPGPNALRFVDFVNFNNSKFSFDTEVVKFEGEFNVNNIMSAAYELFGWRDHYLVVKTYGACPAVQQAMATTAGDCRQMTAMVWPADKAGPSLDGTQQHLAGKLAVYLLKTFLSQELNGKRVDPSRVIPVAEFSDDFASLQATAQGLEILQRGTSHPSCVALPTPDACRKLAENQFEEAVRYDPTNRHAQLGIGLLKLHDVMRRARAGERVFAVLRALSEPGNRLRAARWEATALSEFLDRPNSLANFRLVDLTSLSITSNFTESISHAGSAYHAFVAAKYEDQLKHSQRADLPEELKRFLKGFEYEARLVLAESEETARQLLDELHKLIVNAPDVWIYNIVYATHACRIRLYDRAGRALDRALNIATDPKNRVLYYDTYVWQANCLARQGKLAEATAKIAAVITHLDKLGPEELSSREIQTIYIDLGYYFAAIEDYRAAAANFLQAVARNLCFWPRIREDRQLEQFRNRGEAEFAKLREAIVNQPDENAAACGE